ncbi:MAG: TolC family protein, partial [Bacteroidota bacterium]
MIRKVMNNSNRLFFNALTIICLIVCSTKGESQTVSDTLSLDIPKLEKRFIDSNFLLLAAHFNVDAQKALIEQAKVWQNPTINTDFMVGADGKFFNYGKYDDGKGGHFLGQYYVQIQQLIMTAGKRGKLIKMATTNAKLSELQMQDVLRNLRYQLHQDYYNLSQQLSLLQLYNQ